MTDSEREMLTARILGEAAIVARIAPDRLSRRRRPWVLALSGLASAAAVAAVVLHAHRDRPPEGTVSLASIRALGPTSFSRLQPPPDELVRLDEGAIEVAVGRLGAGQRFRIVTNDAVVDASEGRFRVDSSVHMLAVVRVFAGYAEVRAKGEHATLAAGDEWARPASSEVETVSPQPTSAAPGEGSRTSRPTASPLVARPRPSVATTTGSRTLSEPMRGPAPSSIAPSAEAKAASPLAREAPRVPPSATAAQRSSFERAWSLLRAGDAAGAASAFGEVERLSEGDAIAEDAVFWHSVALARANRKAEAKLALMRFVSGYPGSARIGEASAMLGWMLVDAGDVTGARAAFERAANDPVDRVRLSARQGLERLGARAATP
jgi:TolA-binding protein